MKVMLHETQPQASFLESGNGDRRTEAGHQGEHPLGIAEAVAALSETLISPKGGRTCWSLRAGPS